MTDRIWEYDDGSTTVFIDLEAITYISLPRESDYHESFATINSGMNGYSLPFEAARQLIAAWKAYRPKATKVDSATAWPLSGEATIEPEEITWPAPPLKKGENDV